MFGLSLNPLGYSESYTKMRQTYMNSFIHGVCSSWPKLIQMLKLPLGVRKIERVRMGKGKFSAVSS